MRASHALRFRLRPSARADRAGAALQAQRQPAAARRRRVRAQISRSPICRALSTTRDLVVFNDTRVIKSRLDARRPTGGTVELLLERALVRDEALFQLRASHPPQPGGTLLAARRRARDRRRARRPLLPSAARRRPGRSLDYLDRHGEVPLPPYIARAAGGRCDALPDRLRATCRAPSRRRPPDCTSTTRCSAALASAGDRDRRSSRCTSAPERSSRSTTEDLSAHAMHAERYRIPAETAAAIEAARARGGRVVASARRACARSSPPHRRTAACTPAKAKRGSSSRPATASASSTGCSPISICRNRRC